MKGLSDKGRLQVSEGLDSSEPKNSLPILLLHGAAFTKKMWLPQLEGLAEDFRVMAMDLPGHGSLSGTSFGLETASRAVLRVLDKEECDRAVIVGLSLGGYVAINFAHAHPERASGLVLSGCTVNYRGAMGIVAWVNALLLRAYSDRWLSRTNARTLRKMLPEDLAEAQIGAGFYWKAAGEAFRELAGKDFRARLGSYSGPVLILNGEQDRTNRRGEGLFASAAHNAQLRMIEGAGHGCNLERPAAFTGAVRRFVSTIGPDSDAPGSPNSPTSRPLDG